MLKGFDVSLFSEGDRVLVGLSGGADSVCLLLNILEIAESLSLSVSALHCNHGLRGKDAQRDEDFCKSLCRELCVDIITEQLEVREYAVKNGKSLEEAGRELRYEAFFRYSQGGLVATAHNKNDTAETVLFNLARGSGLKGVSGIPEKRGNIVRPMLKCSRSEIETYLHEKGQSYVTDATNLIPDVSRNKLRLEVIPVLSEINSAAVENISAFAALAATDEDYLFEKAEELYENAQTDDGLDAKTLKDAHRALVGRVIAEFLEKNGFSPTKQIIITIEEYISKEHDISINLSGDVYLYVKQGKIFIAERPCEIADFSAQFKLGENNFPERKIFGRVISFEEYKKIANVHKKFTICALDYDKIIGSLLIRNRRFGDRIQLSGRDFTHRVKKLMESVPVGEKSRRIILEDSEGLVFVEGFGEGERVSLSDGTKNVLILTKEEEL